MKVVEMHEAKANLADLVRAVEEQNEIVILCRNGKAVAELKSPSGPPYRKLEDLPKGLMKLAEGFDPAETATHEDWPEECR